MEHLPRLKKDAYVGRAYVHWNFCVDQRRQGWLNEMFHLKFRELLLHSLVRQPAVCPTYCIMPDHLHLLIVGWAEACDQQILVRFLRRHTNVLLAETGGFKWQKQPFDHVLRKEDRSRDAFAKVAGYIRENPVRAGLVERQDQWPYSGGMVPGYPKLDIHDPNFWNLFWKIYLDYGP